MHDARRTLSKASGLLGDGRVHPLGRLRGLVQVLSVMDVLHIIGYGISSAWEDALKEPLSALVTDDSVTQMLENYESRGIMQVLAQVEYVELPAGSNYIT